LDEKLLSIIKFPRSPQIWCW